ncbi:hypothetical protein [Aestuariicoccus sp. MJ-SS9]|uniref:hypothetical protein n=1 Tax=Aestuariicoccus sp. MJ-SS9 TaxID=3079855 RepID=UPI0029092E4E|nr:hypothetical protein [Aestuariicoccus sp. MJ-SS9]MDU8913234.1 hypothetical protein [Aestuariicoccus sp. MJ-SS9]
MKRMIALILTLGIATPAAAQEAEGDGLSLMEEGAKLFFRGLMDEVEPALKDLQDLAQEMEPALQDFVEYMGPALRELMAEVEDWSAYEPPEMLPNGDIILRRKVPKTPADEGAIEL